MFKVIKREPNRLDIELSGKLDSEEMKTALDELEIKSQGIENGGMLFDAIEYRFPSLKAILIEFSRLPSMFGFIKRFHKAALLSDKQWLKKVSELEGLLIPGLEIKAFNRDQKPEAESWLSE